MPTNETSVFHLIVIKNLALYTVFTKVTTDNAD